MVWLTLRAYVDNFSFREIIFSFNLFTRNTGTEQLTTGTLLCERSLEPIHVAKTIPMKRHSTLPSPHDPW